MSPQTSVRLFIGTLLVLTIALGYNYFFQPFAYLLEPQPQVVLQEATLSAQPTAQPEVYDVMAGLTLRQQIAQLIAAPVTITSQTVSDSAQASSAAALSQLQPGFVTLFGEAVSFQNAERMIAAIEVANALVVPVAEQVTILPAIVVDHEGGTVQRLSGDGFTKLPSWQALCGMEQASRSAVLRRSSLELQEVGIDIVLAPVLDTAEQNRVLGSRICSGDPATVSARSQEYIALFELAEITSVVKHFPGIGTTSRDLHFSFESLQPNQAELNVFRNILEAYPNVGIMSTFVGVTAQDPQTPCALSADCVGQLQTEYPQALLVTDALDMVSAGRRQASGSATLADRSEAAVRAGNDVLLFGEGVSVAQLEGIVEAVAAVAQADPEFQTQLTNRLERVLQYKQHKGLL